MDHEKVKDPDAAIRRALAEVAASGGALAADAAELLEALSGREIGLSDLASIREVCRKAIDDIVNEGVEP